MECICPILPPCLISKMCIYRGKNGSTLSRQGWWGVYCAAKGSRQRSACWWGKLERGYVRVKRSAELFSRRLNGDLAQIGREGLASKYLRQGGGQKLRVGWLAVKLRNPVAGRCWSCACRVFITCWQRLLWIGFRWNERVGFATAVCNGRLSPWSWEEHLLHSVVGQAAAGALCPWRPRWLPMCESLWH